MESCALRYNERQTSSQEERMEEIKGTSGYRLRQDTETDLMGVAAFLTGDVDQLEKS